MEFVVGSLQSADYYARFAAIHAVFQAIYRFGPEEYNAGYCHTEDTLKAL